MSPNQDLINFIKEARKRGFDDFEIKEPLLKKGWPLEDIENAFYALKPKPKFKNKISIFIDNGLLKLLEKRAKKNMFTVSEQIEDILRRSCINTKKKMPSLTKCDDSLVSIFSRAKRNKKKTKK
jgi:hypothetical protein